MVGRLRSPGDLFLTGSGIVACSMIRSGNQAPAASGWLAGDRTTPVRVAVAGWAPCPVRAPDGRQSSSRCVTAAGTPMTSTASFNVRPCLTPSDDHGYLLDEPRWCSGEFTHLPRRLITTRVQSAMRRHDSDEYTHPSPQPQIPVLRLPAMSIRSPLALTVPS